MADVMSINWFEKNKAFTHKDYDKLSKVRPIMNSLVKKMLAGTLREYHPVDEQIIPKKQMGC